MRLSHVIGFDDAPFPRERQAPVLVVGAVYADTRLEGVISTYVRRDGDDATRALAGAVAGSRFAAHLHCILTQGIAFAGFNVVDLQALNRELGVPAMAVMRKTPDLDAIRSALLGHVPGGAEKWAIIERTGAPEPLAGVHVQRAGIDRETATGLIKRLALHGALPEPLRTAHLIAGGVVRGESRGRA